MWKFILFLIGSAILLFGYTLIRSLFVLKPTSEIELLLINTKSSFKKIQKRAERECKLESLYLEQVLKDAKQLRISFATNQIFNEKDPKPTGRQYKLRGELLENMYRLEERLSKQVKKLLIVV